VKCQVSNMSIVCIHEGQYSLVHCVTWPTKNKSSLKDLFISRFKHGDI
jgi:hypothetical protein